MLKASMQLVILIFQMDLFNFFSKWLINIFLKNLKIAISKKEILPETKFKIYI